jgi:XTP/dITP diphosphohydrolase
VTRRLLLVGTQNNGKLIELRELLARLPFELRSLSDLPVFNAVQETGKTFIENAILKATGYARQANLLTLADDSGLEVDALNGAPGVFSARYAGPSVSDAERTQKLLSELSDTREKKRSARFVSVVAIANREGKILNISVGTCAGRIGFKRAGSGALVMILFLFPSDTKEPLPNWTRTSRIRLAIAQRH